MSTANLTKAQKAAAAKAKKAELALQAQAEADKAQAQASAPKSPRAKAEIQNGVRRPVKGLCANVWLYLASQPSLPSVADVKAWGVANGLNVTNCVIEYYGYRKFHGMRGRGAVTGVTLSATA